MCANMYTHFFSLAEHTWSSVTLVLFLRLLCVQSQVISTSYQEHIMPHRGKPLSQEISIRDITSMEFFMECFFERP